MPLMPKGFRRRTICRVLGAVDDDLSELGAVRRCVQIALRYRKFFSELPAITPGRDEKLDKNAMELADILTALDRQKEADGYLQQILSQAQKQNNPIRTLNVLVKIGREAETQGDNAKAKNSWSQVIALGLQSAGTLERQLPKSKSEYTDCMVDLAAAYAASNRLPEASAVYQRLLSKQQAPEDAAAAIQSRINLASIYAETGQHQQALKVFGEGSMHSASLPSIRAWKRNGSHASPPSTRPRGTTPKPVEMGTSVDHLLQSHYECGEFGRCAGAVDGVARSIAKG